MVYNKRRITPLDARCKKVRMDIRKAIMTKEEVCGVARTADYRYLGVKFTAWMDLKSTVLDRITKAREAMSLKNALWKHPKIGCPLKRRLMTSFVYPILLYGLDTLPLETLHEKLIATFVRQAEARILGCNWWNGESSRLWVNPGNEGNIRLMDIAEKVILDRLEKARLRFVGHVLRGGGLPNILMSKLLEEEGENAYQLLLRRNALVPSDAMDREKWRSRTFGL